jgi:hypothetical protein
VKDIFIETIVGILDYWYRLPDKTVRERMEGAIFSTLVILDGGSPVSGPFSVRSIDENGKEGEDIAGGLHELFCHKLREQEIENNDDEGRDE